MKKNVLKNESLFIIKNEKLYKQWKAELQILDGDEIDRFACIIKNSHLFSNQFFEKIVEKMDLKNLVFHKEDIDINTSKDNYANFLFFNKDNILSSSFWEKLKILKKNKLNFSQLNNKGLNVLYPVISNWCDIPLFLENTNELKTYEKLIHFLVGHGVEFNKYVEGNGYSLDIIGNSYYENESYFLEKMWDILIKNNISPNSGPFNYTSICARLNNQINWAWENHSEQMYKVYSRMLKFLENQENINSQKKNVINLMKGHITHFEKNLLIKHHQNNLNSKIKIL